MKTTNINWDNAISALRKGEKKIAWSPNIEFLKLLDCINLLLNWATEATVLGFARSNLAKINITKIWNIVSWYQLAATKSIGNSIKAQKKDTSYIFRKLGVVITYQLAPSVLTNRPISIWKSWALVRKANYVDSFQWKSSNKQ